MNPNPRTYSATADELNPRWYVIDAKDLVLGRLASDVAQVLRGKWKPTFTPHMLCGDYVVVINAAKVDVTRNRRELKVYFRHSQYPGGGKSETLRQALERHPERVIERAVRGMLPRNRLGDDMMGRLKVYPGERHPHAAQQPTPWVRPTAESVLAEQAEQEQKASSAQA
ncbi:MAG TPA: 50S ribosomal protein L13 [Ktedonobacterales bacterium]|jgi:large subunit ribosomal protein L13|nr:50S ribosomal protein L13 [Ktedonobacterales bacterium]